MWSSTLLRKISRAGLGGRACCCRCVDDGWGGSKVWRIRYLFSCIYAPCGWPKEDLVLYSEEVSHEDGFIDRVSSCLS